MRNGKAEITVKVTIDRTAHKIEARRAGCKLPFSAIYSDSHSALAGAYRDCAAYFLELAHAQDHTEGFYAPFTNAAREEQARLMLEDHRNIFEVGDVSA